MANWYLQPCQSDTLALKLAPLGSKPCKSVGTLHMRMVHRHHRTPFFLSLLLLPSSSGSSRDSLAVRIWWKKLMTTRGWMLKPRTSTSRVQSLAAAGRCGLRPEWCFLSSVFGSFKRCQLMQHKLCHLQFSYFISSYFYYFYTHIITYLPSIFKQSLWVWLLFVAFDRRRWDHCDLSI